MNSGSFGMMNEAYFVSKSRLIDWVNNFLDVRIERVEDCASGALYCNIWDALHSQTIPIKKVDFTVREEYEFVKNWKLLQEGFARAGVQKMIPVERLIKARYQDNLEFLQWMYKYAHDVYSGDADNAEYDALTRRSRSKGGRDYVGPNQSNNNRRTSTRNRSNKENVSERPSSARPKALPRSSSTNSGRLHGGASRTSNTHSKQSNEKLEKLSAENKDLRSRRDEMETKFVALQNEHNELSSVAKDIEKERDFYFNKVLEVERLCKESPDQDHALLQKILGVLYQEDGEGDSSAAIDNQPDFAGDDDF